MATPVDEKIREVVVELCSEDDWGSWELWWNVAGSAPAAQIDTLKESFINVVDDMNAAGQLFAKRRTASGELSRVEYDRDVLSRELDFAHDPDPESFYWFGIR